MSRPGSTVPTREELIARLIEVRKKNELAERSLAERDEEIMKVKALSVETQRVAEIEEERMGNTLLKRMDALKQRNSALENAIQQNERRNATILGELATVRKTKVEVENRIEQEQERMMNTLQKQLLALATEKSKLERQLHLTREEVLATLQSEVEKLRSRAQTPLSPESASFASAANTSVSSKAGAGAGDAEKPAAASGTPLTPHRRHSTVLEVEAELRQLLQETKVAQVACEQSDAQYKKMADNLRILQNEAFLARAKTAKFKEELERAQAALAIERASAAETPRGGRSAETTPVIQGAAATQLSSPGGPPLGTSAAATGGLPPSSRTRHARTVSGSSVESWSSSSTATAPTINAALTRPDPESVRQHTARVLSSTTLAYPAPQKSQRASSAHSSNAAQYGS